MFYQTIFKGLSLFLVMVFLVLYSYYGGFFAREIVTTITIFAIVAVSLDFVSGYGGMVSLCHGAIFGLGAYVYAVVNTMLMINPIVAVFIAIFICFIFGLLMGAVATRTHGIFFIMCTLAFGQILYVLIFDSQYLGGDDGMWGLTRIDLSFLGLNLNDSLQFALFCLACLLITYTFLAFILHSGFGQALVGIRENEGRMRALGISIWKIKPLAFGLSAGFSGLAGTLSAQHIMFVSPELLVWTVSGEILIITILGGLSTLFGPIVGSLVLVMTKHSLSEYTDYWHLVVGLILIIVVLANGRGIYGELERIYIKITKKPSNNTKELTSDA